MFAKKAKLYRIVNNQCWRRVHCTSLPSQGCLNRATRVWRIVNGAVSNGITIKLPITQPEQWMVPYSMASLSNYPQHRRNSVWCRIPFDHYQTSHKTGGTVNGAEFHGITVKFPITQAEQWMVPHPMASLSNFPQHRRNSEWCRFPYGTTIKLQTTQAEQWMMQHPMASLSNFPQHSRNKHNQWVKMLSM